jgi:CHASE3 domain sensor protein
LEATVHLNIRQKVILGLVICVLAVGFIGGFSYHYLRAIEVKQHIVQIADDLREIILEIRRYEKNYLLYGQQEDYRQNQQYTQQALEDLSKIAGAKPWWTCRCNWWLSSAAAFWRSSTP